MRKAIIGALGLFAAAAVTSQACSMTLLDPETPPVAGETGVLVVHYENTHRNCGVPLDSTQFEAEGLTILGATPWKEIRPGVFQRKFKVKYETIEPALKVVRVCPKGGLEKRFPIGSRK